MKILISSASFGKINRVPLETLENAGFKPVLNPYGRKLEFSEFVELIKDAVGLIAGRAKITAELQKNTTKKKGIFKNR